MYITSAHTGEEDEDTVYQARIKLFVMDDKGTWRERGTGQLRINVDKKRSGTAPRLGRLGTTCFLTYPIG
jgi:Ran-binding protein 3